jgi:murein DD-endopeptidase MepM/ murein hydrolase activator NlpD
MKRIAVQLAALAALALTTVGAASAQVFHVVTPPDTPSARVPSYTVPNAANSLKLPSPLDRPPAVPEVRSYEELLELWHRAGAAYGVPWDVLAAINKIESNFGQNMGPSYAGALGWMQFIPSSWLRWGMDADGDGIADPWNPDDAVFAAARYLAAAGAHESLSRAIFAYNHAQWYVDDVLRLARVFRKSDSGFAFGEFAFPAPSSDVLAAADLEARLAGARRQVTKARQAIPNAERMLEKLERRRLALERRAGNLKLSDAKFADLEKRIAGLEREQLRTERGIAQAGLTLEKAVAAVDALRAEAESAALQPEQAAVTATPAGDYVFPVGGGPELVSVAHDHHDYPAADIAAPEGSPLYALANSTVAATYPDGGGRCGIGLKLRVDSGALYVYCHLAYLEPSVTPGTALAAGAPVGLVGSTGNSTGPHLHLQYSPAVAYPQAQPWFESFAGAAFSWQDAPTPRVHARSAARAAKPAQAAPVFHVVGAPTMHVERVVTFSR